MREYDLRNLECRKCGIKWDNCRTVALDHITLERLVFYLAESPQAVVQGNIRVWASI